MAKKSIESGSLYFFYRPKIHEDKVRNLDDVQRFYMVLAAQESGLFRLIIVGQKYMPEIIQGEAAPSERNWAIVDYVTENGHELVKERLGWEKSAEGITVYPPRPVGVAEYQLIIHEDHSELAYALESPVHPGSVQETFNIYPEASYIVKIKNPNISARGYPGAGEKPGYPPELEKLFTESWINVKDIRLLNYVNTQILLLGARKENIEKELGIKFKKKEASEAVDELYSTLGINKEDYPSKPLVTGQWPRTKEAP